MVCQRSHRALQPALLHRLHGPIESDPGHDFRVGELARVTADLPDAVIGVLPIRLQEIEQRALYAPCVLVRVKATSACQVQGIHDLSIDVQLQLPGGCVAYSYRPRAAVSVQPWNFPLVQSSFASQSVHDLHLGRHAGNRPQQPISPGSSLVVIAADHERVECEGRVADPAEAIVPVADAAEMLGQRRRGGGHDPAGGCVGQGFQHDQRSLHLIFPAPLIGASRRPIAATSAGSPPPPLPDRQAQDKFREKDAR